MKTPLDCKVALAGALLLGAATFAAPALAQETQQSAQETQVAEQTTAREPTVLICKVFAVTGTRIQHEYCLTQDDWDMIRKNSREALEILRGSEIG